MAAPPAYIISKVADPIFALVIGLGAAATRINREEKEKGRTTQETIAAAQRHVISLLQNMMASPSLHGPD
ncbi:hypothetical protein CKAH01_00025 [Colletotrichum kahawae]|uniref:Non-classical export protein 1 n=1 Tax=Colletotrichum kahawae TaxID=34407 RepID=A0AAD9YUH5_COLKA|nr:hypothetical protein CKAH01_00025 [Colletotrichum kahawae]